MEIWPSDLTFGIFGYNFDRPGVGGRLKLSPDDFEVVEIDEVTKQALPFPPNKMYDHGDGGGLYLVGRVWKRGIDHSRMVRQIAGVFGVEQADVSTAGIKDKQAVTVQLFSVYQPRKKVSDPIQIADGLEIDSFSWYREKIYPGRSLGNKFNITIRDTEVYDESVIDDFNKFGEDGLINYYGYQRFGGSRPITAEFGRYIATKKYKDAINLYLGGRSAHDDEQYRLMWRENQDPEQLLLEWNYIPMIEKDILRQLVKRPNDYATAIKRIPPFLINLSQSSFVSLMTNHYLSRRGLESGLLNGEREKDGNIEIALPSKMWKEPLNDIWNEVFDSENVEIADLKSIRHTTRELYLYPKDLNIEYIDETTIKTSFSLAPGSYATVLLRELMKSEPLYYGI
jgi:tRNA pseudouridine13 synthase